MRNDLPVTGLVFNEAKKCYNWWWLLHFILVDCFQLAGRERGARERRAVHPTSAGFHELYFHLLAAAAHSTGIVFREIIHNRYCGITAESGARGRATPVTYKNIIKYRTKALLAAKDKLGRLPF